MAQRPDHSLRQGGYPGTAPHPAAVILLWLFLAIALQSLHVTPMLLTGALLMAAALRRSALRLYALLRRTRWVMISLLVIYGFVTPGEALWAAAGPFSPTLQGLADGAVQLCRLVFALAGLAIVLNVLDQARLMGGIYVLAAPLRLLGLSRERVAVRLALTLNYAETAMLETAADWRGSIEHLLAPPADEVREVEIPVIPFRLRDAALLVAGGVALAAALL
jgi:hypothetical protein